MVQVSKILGEKQKLPCSVYNFLNNTVHTFRQLLLIHDHEECLEMMEDRVET